MNAVNTKALEKQLAVVVDTGRSFRITSKALYQEAGHHLTEKVDPLIAEIKNTFDPICKATDEAHKEAVKQRDRFLKPALQIRDVLRNGMGRYIAEETRKQDEERRRKEAEARAKEEERRKDEVAALKAQGADEEAAELEAAPVIVAPVKVREVPKVDGVSYADQWGYTVTDEMALKEYLWAVHRSLLVVDSSALLRLVGSLKDGARDIKGIEVTCRKVPRNVSKRA